MLTLPASKERWIRLGVSSMRRAGLHATAAASIGLLCGLPALAGPEPVTTAANLPAADMTEDLTREAPRPVGWVLLAGGLGVAGASLLRRRKITKPG